VAGRITSVEKSNDLIGNRTRDFPVEDDTPVNLRGVKGR
jgi:hypothetical protein